jgi:hypothetical protein
MIGVKEAVQAAATSVESLYPDARGIRLEEVQNIGPFWSVVMSFNTGEPTTLASVMGTEARLFKRVEIDPDTGSLIALKVWKQ